MSELTPCNFCNLKRIKGRRLSGQRVRVIPATGNTLRGFNVYLFYAGEKIDHKRHFVSWMMEIPDKCCC